MDTYCKNIVRKGKIKTIKSKNERGGKEEVLWKLWNTE